MTRAHFDAGSARVKAKGAAYLPRSQLAHVLDKKPAASAPAPKKPRAPPRKRGGDDSDAEKKPAARKKRR